MEVPYQTARPEIEDLGPNAGDAPMLVASGIQIGNQGADARDRRFGRRYFSISASGSDDAASDDKKISGFGE